jgi:predicted nuclease with TOPRIM domain
MTANENALTTFETRVRQLLLRFKDLKAENATLTDMLHKSEEAVKEVQQKLAQQQQDYETLKMAKMIEITDGNLQGAKDRLSRLIRDVNKCIAILSDEKG